MSEICVRNHGPEIVHTLIGHKKLITCLRFHPNSQQLASGSEDSSIILWNLTTKHARSIHFSGHTDTVTSIDFTQNGKLFASSSYDKNIRLWTPTAKTTTEHFRAHDKAVTFIEFSSTESKLVSGSADHLIKIWDVNTQTSIQQYTDHTDTVNCVRHAYDGKIIASCSNDLTLKLFDVNSGSLIHSFPPTKGIGNYLSLRPTSYSVAVAMNSGSIRIYDIRAMKLKQHYVLHNNTTCVQWHPYANYLITSGEDGEICLIDLAEGKPLYTLKRQKEIKKCVDFSMDGVYFASGGADKLLEVYKTNFIVLSDKENQSENNL